MAASKGNYIIVYETISQVYSAATLETAVKTPLPKGCSEEDKHILFATYEPDNKNLCVYKIPQEEIDQVLLKIKEENERKTKKESNE